MTRRAWMLCLALSLPATVALTPRDAHADIGSRCDALSREWDQAIRAKSDKRQIASLKDRITQKSASCPTLLQRANAYRPPVKEMAASPRKPAVAVTTPPQPTVRMPACLAAIVEAASADAKTAYNIARQAQEASEEGERRAAQQHAQHPNKPSAPPEGQWKYADGHIAKYWGDTVANMPEGYGVMEFDDGRRSAGMFKAGSMGGYAVYKDSTSKTQSMFGGGLVKGFGTVEYATFKRVGFIEDNEKTKYIVIVFKDGSSFKGQFYTGKNEPLGALFDANNRLVSQGFFNGYAQVSRPVTTSDCSG